MTPTFEGWYFKHQTKEQTLCLIPGRADSGAFIQVITEDASYVVDFPMEQYHAYSRGPLVAVGENRFSRRGMRLSIHTPVLSLVGTVHYRGLTPLRYDIMGPFALLPMETHHTVVSMSHGLSGALCLNGRPIRFDGGKGYIEGGRGRSFPQQYAWVQCNAFSQDASVMLSIAQIPLGPARFWGCIGVVWLGGREYRFATYKGVRILHRSRDRLEGALGFESLILDIICTFVWTALGFVISYKLYYSHYRLERYFPLFCVLFAGQLAVQILFTPFAPSLPLFEDHSGA